MPKLYQNLLLLFISLIFSILAVELLLRIFVEQETKRLATYDSELGWTGQPNGEEVFIRKADGIRTKFKYNNIGFRDDDITEKKSTEKRLLMLGDSFVENLEVTFDSVFHQIVERELLSLGAYDRVVAIGSQGYSTAQEILAYRKFKNIVNPDLVLLLFYTGNDFDDNQRKQFARLDKNGELHFPQNTDSAAKIQYLKFKRWIYENSHLVFFLKNMLASYGFNIRSEARKKVATSSNDYPFKITSALLDQFKHDMEEDGMPYGIVIFPRKEHLKGSPKIDFVIDFCVEHDIPYISFQDKLELASYFEHDVHFNKFGHEIVAENLTNFIIDNF